MEKTVRMVRMVNVESVVRDLIDDIAGGELTESQARERLLEYLQKYPAPLT